MRAIVKDARFDTDTGRVKVTLNTSTINGYSNEVDLYEDYASMSVPLPGQMANIIQEAATSVYMSGYKNTITDANFTMEPGDKLTGYSQNWYTFTANAGVSIQQRNTANKENAMMGQSTNHVLVDILDILIQLISWATDHTHSGVTSGGSNSGVSVQTPPSAATITTDKDYITANKNLAITGTYTPY